MATSFSDKKFSLKIHAEQSKKAEQKILFDHFTTSVMHN